LNEDALRSFIQMGRAKEHEYQRPDPLGVPLGEAQRRAIDFITQFILRGGDKTRLEEEVRAIVASPASFAEDPLRKEFAKAIVNAPPPPRMEPAPFRQWGSGLEPEAVDQMSKACLLPVSLAGALMPDAHVGLWLAHRWRASRRKAR
jgi:tRNA-splicing ligase RtcB